VARRVHDAEAAKRGHPEAGPAPEPGAHPKVGDPVKKTYLAGQE